MSTRELMYAIADRMGKRRADMEQFITIFQQNWFNNSESLKTLRPADYEKYRIPAGLANIIMERLGVKQETSMDIESPVEDSLRALKRKVSSETFADMVSTLLRIFTNIRENLM